MTDPSPAGPPSDSAGDDAPAGPGSAAADALRWDTMSEELVRPRLLACLAAPDWAQALLEGRPHHDTAGWLTAAQSAFAALSDDAVLVALQAHPRIGDSPQGHAPDADSSRREQAGAASASEPVRAAIAAGNRLYEERFDRVFLIRAAGRSGQEILAELRRRLGNDDAAEFGEAREQLRQITVLRLEGVLRG